MLFNSLEFFLFFLIVYPLYLLLKHRWQNSLLVVSSCLFYAAWNWKFLALILISVSTDYFCAQKIYTTQNANRRKLFLFISIFVNLSILGFFKYFNFFAANMAELLKFFHLSLPLTGGALKIILPLGISFYTFEAISYTVDVYRRQVEPAKKYWDYVLFIIYFPHLIAGPIMRARNFLPQITSPRALNLELFFEGCYLFFWGLFEKMYVADNLAKIVNPVFALKDNDQGATILLALYAFAFQIFCDFDGYSNMARGLGKMMGFDITINFKLPYFAANPREFWQRWHISLSSWLRDYLYIPLGGNRLGAARMFGAVIATFFLGGLWHGAAWNFIFWGFYQAMLLIIYHPFSKEASSEQLRSLDFKRFIKIIIFFHLTVLGWLFFRAQSIDQIIRMLHALIFNFNAFDQNIILWIKLAAFTIPLLLVQWWQYKTSDLMILTKQHWFFKSIIYAFLTYLLLGWGVMKSEEFIYFQF